MPQSLPASAHVTHPINPPWFRHMFAAPMRSANPTAMPNTPLPRSGILALVALCAVWGYTWVILKEGVRFADPWDYATLRTLPGAIVLFAIAAWRGEPLALRSPRHVFILGLWQTTAFNGLVSWALVSGAAGKTAVLVYTMPFWTVLIAWPVLGERIRGTQWLAVALSAAGLLLVLEPWKLQGTLTANMLAVLTGVSWAVAAVLTRRWREHLAVGTFALTAWQMLLGGLVLAVAGFFLSARPIEWTPYFWFLLIYATLFGTVLGWALWFYVLKLLPAGVAALAVMAVPAIGVLSSRLQLGERPGTIESLGMLLIGASLAVLSWTALRNRAAARSH